MPCGRKSPFEKLPPEKKEAVKALAKKLKSKPEITNPHALARYMVMKKGAKVKET